MRKQVLAEESKENIRSEAFKHRLPCLQENWLKQLLQAKLWEHS